MFITTDVLDRILTLSGNPCLAYELSRLYIVQQIYDPFIHTPMYLINTRNVRFLTYMKNTYPFPFNDNHTRLAFYTLHPEIIEYVFIDQRAPYALFAKEIAIFLAEQRQYELLKTLYRRYKLFPTAVGPIVARQGDASFVMWLRRRSLILLDEHVMTAAVESKNLKLVHFLWSRHCPLFDGSFQAAIRAQSVEIIQFLYSKKCAISPNLSYKTAVKYDAYELLDLLWDYQLRFDKSTIMKTVLKYCDELDIIRWFYARGALLSSPALHYAVTCKQEETWDLLFELYPQDMCSDYMLYHIAADTKRTDAIKWLKTKNVPWIPSTIQALLEIADYDFLQWMSNFTDIRELETDIYQRTLFGKHIDHWMMSDIRAMCKQFGIPSYGMNKYALYLELANVVTNL